MLANYEVEMLTGNGGWWGSTGRLQSWKCRREEEAVEIKKDEEREPGRRLGMSNLIGMFSFHLRTLSLLLKKI